jgi:hypothetical protein
VVVDVSVHLFSDELDLILRLLDDLDSLLRNLEFLQHTLGDIYIKYTSSPG